MANRIRIAQGNDLPLRSRLNVYNNGEIIEVPCVEVENLRVYYGSGKYEKAVEEGNILNHTFVGNTVHFRLESSQIWGLKTYNIWIVGFWRGNDISFNYGEIIETIQFSEKTNVEQYVYDEEVELAPAIFIPQGLSAEEIDRLAKEWEEKVRQVENAASIEYVEEVKSELETKIAQIHTFETKKVEVLPEIGEDKVLYLVPSHLPKAVNLCDEFIWVDGNYEQVGITAANLEPLESDIADLNAAVFPLVVGWASSNAGTYEVGTEVTPTATAAARRKGKDVAASSTMSVSGATVEGLTATKAAQSSGSTSMAASISQGGQTMTTATLNWSWTYYRYRGEVSTVPTNYAAAIKALATKELTTASTLGSTALSANKYYLFAVKGTANLVCRHASTDGVIGGCIKGTATINRQNETGSDIYSYILIPASTQSWNFKITNA